MDPTSRRKVETGDGQAFELDLGHSAQPIPSKPSLSVEARHPTFESTTLQFQVPSAGPCQELVDM